MTTDEIIYDLADKIGQCIGKLLIHCNECKYYQHGNFTGEEWKWCMVHHNYTEEENFCSWAERKEE